MEEVKKNMKEGKTYAALKRLKKIEGEYENSSEEWKIHELFGAIFHDIGESEGVAQAYLNAAKCDKYLRSQRSHYSNYLFALHYLSEKYLEKEHEIYNELYKKEKIRVGYLSNNFCESSSARFYEGLLTEYNREEFEVKCFTLSDEIDEFTMRIKEEVEYYELKNLSIEEQAERIYSEHVDILFDLSGHSDGGMTLQIMSYKPAQIQITGIGYFDTTGLKAIDYFMSDEYLGLGEEKNFTEKLIKLSSAFAFSPSREMKKIKPKKNLHEEIIFGCFNNFMKVTDEYLKCVKKILGAIEKSKFIMQDTTNITARKIEMERRLKELKFDMDKIEIRVGNDEYLNDYAGIDIMLDTFPYNGCAMTATALYMNVPVISLKGNRHYSRFGTDILRLANYSEWIAEDENNFVEKAINLAKNFKYKNLRDEIKTSKLLDTKSFVKEVENNFRKLVK